MWEKERRVYAQTIADVRKSLDNTPYPESDAPPFPPRLFPPSPQHSGSRRIWRLLSRVDWRAWTPLHMDKDNYQKKLRETRAAAIVQLGNPAGTWLPARQKK